MVGPGTLILMAAGLAMDASAAAIAVSTRGLLLITIGTKILADHLTAV